MSRKFAWIVSQSPYLWAVTVWMLKRYYRLVR
jgi:hypothetical protein